MNRECSVCGRWLSPNNLQKHIESHDKKKRDRIKIPDDALIDGLFQCWICNDFRSATKAGVATHICRAHSADTSRWSGRPKGIPAWNKGLTKDTSPVIKDKAAAQSIRAILDFQTGARKPSIMSLAKRRELSIRQSLRNSGGKCKWFEIDGRKVQGTWEKNLAEKFLSLGIDWTKPSTNTETWSYEDDAGELHTYSPDFYLPRYDIWLEIKGYWWGNDRKKMRSVMCKYPDRAIIIVESQLYRQLLECKTAYQLEQQFQDPTKVDHLQI